jgi:hypothetical protein
MLFTDYLKACEEETIVALMSELPDPHDNALCEIAQVDLREFHLARDRGVQQHQIPQLPHPSTATTAGLRLCHSQMSRQRLNLRIDHRAAEENGMRQTLNS